MGPRLNTWLRYAAGLSLIGLGLASLTGRRNRWVQGMALVAALAGRGPMGLLTPLAAAVTGGPRRRRGLLGRLRRTLA